MIFLIIPVKVVSLRNKKSKAMTIRPVSDNKKQFLDLLLLGDEQESMIDRYLEQGDLFALYDGDLKSVCVIVGIDDSTCELKNIATYEKYQGQGYGSALVNYLFDYYKDKYKTMLVGTGDVPSALSFYRHCGFEPSHRVKNFFTDNYDHPMSDNGIQLVDMVYLKKDLSAGKVFHIRPATVSDIPEMTELYKNTILTVNRKDYSAEEVEEWASCGNDIRHLCESFAEQYYIVAENDKGKIVGFASINDTGYMHTLFVHKDFQHQGIATLLYRAIEKHAKEKGVEKITSEVSITARPFFEKQGFVVDEEQKRKANKLFLTNYKMIKQLNMEFVLRKFSDSDLTSLVKYANNYNIARFLTNGFPHPYSEEDGQRFLSMASNNPGIFAIDIDGEAVGSIGIFPQSDIHEKNAEMGYWLAEPFWGKGIIPRAIKEIVEYGFKTFDITRIFARPFSTNSASQRVLEKAGFVCEARLKDAIYKNGNYMDELIYAIRKDEQKI